MTRPRQAGRFITFEGIDGSGKSTQARLLAERLRNAGEDVILTREPGGSPGAEEIRSLVLTGETGRWSAETEILLFTAARRDHLEKTILPALDAGRTVICDRFADSTRVYQGATRGDLRRKVDQLHAAMIGREPDRTFIIDMDPAKALARAESRAVDAMAETSKFPCDEVEALVKRSGVTASERDDPAEMRFEAFGLGFQETIRHGFLALARDNPDRCTVIDGDRPAEAIASEVAARL